MKKTLHELCSIIAGLDSTKDVHLLLTDLLTPKELGQLEERWNIVKRLNEGESQRKIAKELGVGIMTVTRGSAQLKKKNGGLELALKRGGYL